MNIMLRQVLWAILLAATTVLFSFMAKEATAGHGESFQDSLDDPPYYTSRYPFIRFRPYFRPTFRGFNVNFDAKNGSWVRGGYETPRRGAVVIGYNRGLPTYRCKGMYREAIYYGETYDEKCYVRYRGRYRGLARYKVLVR